MIVEAEAEAGEEVADEEEKKEVVVEDWGSYLWY